MMTDSFELHSQLKQDSFEIAELPLCSLLLCNDSAYPWFILVPRIVDIEEIYQLDWQDQQQLMNESSLLGELLMQEFKGDKLNIAAIGNLVPQLHIHHIVRFKEDRCWPKPIWGQYPAIPYSSEEISTIKNNIMAKLSIILATDS